MSDHSLSARTISSHTLAIPRALKEIISPSALPRRILRRGWQNIQGEGRHSLGGRVDDELDTLVDVGLQALERNVEQLLLVIVGLANNVDNFLGAIGLQ